LAHPIIEWLKREISKNPEIMKIIEEESGPYGPAIKEKGWELIKPKPREEGEEYPFFPPGIFSPYPKAFDDQGEWSRSDNAGNGGGSEERLAWGRPERERIDQLVDRVLGASSQEDKSGREKRPFYFV